MMRCHFCRHSAHTRTGKHSTGINQETGCDYNVITAGF